MKRIIILVVIIVLAQYSKAQSLLLDSAKHELYRINKVFDSSQYLGFNLGISYRSDSANITMETDQVDGNYVLNKHNMYYQMGSTIYVQTDSFAYNIYPDEKMMIMTKNMVVEASTVFPLKNFVDSMVYYYGANYTVSVEAIALDSFEFVRRIRFDKITTAPTPNAPNGPQGPAPVEGMQYNYFYIDYNYGIELGYYHPIKFEFAYDEEARSEILDSSGNNVNTNLNATYMATKTVTMNFSNFRPMMGTEVFNDNKYVFYNRQRKIYEPTNDYREYQLTTSGFDNEDDDAEFFREIPARRDNN
jgi:hypothetical protein